MQPAQNLAHSRCSESGSALSLEVILMTINLWELAIHKDIAHGVLVLESLLDFTRMLDTDGK